MGANGTSWYLRGFLGGRRCREVGLLGLVHLKPCRPGLLVSSVPAPGEAGGFQAGSPSLSPSHSHPLYLSPSLSHAGLRAGRHHHPRGGGGDPMLHAGQGGELPGLQPPHGERSASCCPAPGGGGRGGHWVPTWPRAADRQGAEFTAQGRGVRAVGAGQLLSGRATEGGQGVPRAWGNSGHIPGPSLCPWSPC